MVAKRKKTTAMLLDLQSVQKDSKPTVEKSIPSLATPRSRIKADHLVKHSPLTQTQEKLFEAFSDNYNIVADGCPGTGKTYVSMYCALQDVLVNRKYSKIVIIRSIVPSREIGFLPGSIEEKISVYEQPYKDACRDLFVNTISTPYDKCKEQGLIEFMPTSFVRGTSINDAIIILDEVQNLNFSEASTILTRVGRNSKIILCGDFYQTDLNRKGDQSGYPDIKNIMKTMNSVRFIEFNENDIVRSGFVKEFIKAKIKLGYQ